LALGKGQPLALLILINVFRTHTDDAKLALTDHTVSHPLDLVHKLKITVSNAADRNFVHVFDPFDIVRVILVL
jgi:hypothetical protein